MWLFGGDKRRKFEQLARPLLKPLYQTALRLTRQTEWAEDLTQDTLVRAYERFHLFTPGTNFRAWLFTILTRLYLNDCERARRRPSLVSLQPDGDEGEERDFPSRDASGDPEAALLQNVLPEDIQNALDALPEEFRVAVILVDLEDLSYQEVATALDAPVGTIRSRVSRGRGLLKKMLNAATHLLLV